MLEKTDICHNNPKTFYTEKKAKHKPSGYALVTCCSFDKTKTAVNYDRGKDCMKIFCKDLKNQAMKIINYKKKKEIILTEEEKESYKSQKNCHICGKEFKKMQKKSVIMIIIQENIEELLIVIVIYAIKYQEKFLQYFIMDLHMIIIL